MNNLQKTFNNSNISIISLLTTLLFLILVNPSSTDEVHMKTGRIIKCTVILEEEDTVEIKVGAQKLTIPRSRITKITISSPEDILLDAARDQIALKNKYRGYDFLTEYIQKNPDKKEIQNELKKLEQSILKDLDDEFYREIRTRDYDVVIDGIKKKIRPDRPVPPSMIFLEKYLASWYDKRAQSYYDNLNYHKAEQDLLHATRYDSADRKSSYLLAKIYFENLKAPKKAELYMDKVCSETEPTVEQLMLQLKLKLRLKKLSEARKVITQLNNSTNDLRAKNRMKEQIRPVLKQMLNEYEEQQSKGSKERMNSIQCFEAWYETWKPEPPLEVMRTAMNFYDKYGMIAEKRELEKIFEDLERTEKLKEWSKILSPTTEKKVEVKPVINKNAPALSQRLIERAQRGFFYDDNVKQIKAMAWHSDKLILVFFTGLACPNCVEFELRHLKDEKFRRNIGKNFIMLKINLDEPEALPYREKFDISGRPSFVIMDDSENLIDTISYQSDPEKFVQQIEKNSKIQESLKKKTKN